MVNPAVPERIRRLINVESGLNDGIATPFVLVAVAGADTSGHTASTGPAAGGRRAGAGRDHRRGGGRRRWLPGASSPSPGLGSEGSFAGSAVLALAAGAYASALALHGNGFIAAFVGGLAFGAIGGQRGEQLMPFVEETGALVSLLVWLAFGAVVVVPALQGLTWQTIVYAVLSLTVIRMAPVALALAGGGLGRAAVLSVGWFGPRGLASVVFAMIALEDLDQHVAGPAVAVITVTVLLSVVGTRRRPPIRWPAATGRGSPWPRAALLTWVHPSCLSAGSSVVPLPSATPLNRLGPPGKLRLAAGRDTLACLPGHPSRMTPAGPG